MKTIRVVAAVICDSIEHKTKIFSTARGYGEFKGGWEFGLPSCPDPSCCIMVQPMRLTGQICAAGA